MRFHKRRSHRHRGARSPLLQANMRHPEYRVLTPASRNVDVDIAKHRDVLRDADSIVEPGCS